MGHPVDIFITIAIGSFGVFVSLLLVWEGLKLWSCKKTFGAFPPRDRLKRENFLSEVIIPKMEQLATKVFEVRNLRLERMQQGIQSEPLEIHGVIYDPDIVLERNATLAFQNAEQLVSKLGFKLPPILLEYPTA